jgi:hypothetical protein
MSSMRTERTTRTHTGKRSIDDRVSENSREAVPGSISEGRYLTNVVDGKVTVYGRRVGTTGES